MVENKKAKEQFGEVWKQEIMDMIEGKSIGRLYKYHKKEIAISQEELLDQFLSDLEEKPGEVGWSRAFNERLVKKYKSLKTPTMDNHEMSKTKKITRVDVIDHTKSLDDGGGLILSKWDIKVSLLYQDDDRTLKVVIEPKTK